MPQNGHILTSIVHSATNKAPKQDANALLAMLYLPTRQNAHFWDKPYVGGDAGLLGRMEPLLMQIGARCFHFGPVGTAADAKLVMNMMLANLMQAMAEGFVYADKAGLDMKTFREAYKANAGHSVLAEMKVSSMIAGDYTTHFSLKHMDKDVRLALARGAELGVVCPLTQRLKEVFSAGMAEGWGEEDFSVLYRLAARNSGL